MEGMLDNPRNILLWITSESTSSESQNSLFVELHHTSIICLTSRSIKLMIEALFCSGNYVFSFAQLLQILISISETVLSWYHGQVSGCVRMLLLPQLGPLSWLFISSPRCRHRAHRSLASALYTITIGTTCVSTGKKVLATKWLLAWQEQQSVPSHNISSLLKKMRTVPGVIWPDILWFLNHQAIATKTVWPR